MRHPPQIDKHLESGKIVAIYAVFGFGWIYLSDRVLGWLVHDPEVITTIGIFKGLLFIVCTSLLLFFLISRLGKKIKRSTDALAESEERLRLLVKNGSDILVILNEDQSQRYVSPAAERITGFAADELERQSLDSLIHKDDLDGVNKAWREAVEHPEKTVMVQYRHIHKSRDWVYCEATAQSFLSEPAINGIIASVRDITERRKAEEERKRLQVQLTQAHKMESVGRLAGGVAHDFNNMLGVILGHTEMALDQIDPGEPLYDDLQEINKAARRSADLTQQLLAFARKQTITPKVLDLNETVEKMITMLRRLIGEDIHLSWLPGEGLKPIKIDPSQIDQILANLCVNARDAISDTGEITIETGTASFDETYCTEHAGTCRGEYVLLAVSDNGCGMSKETLSLLFEPFFTTKKVGKGTGLGLAMVYGIVKQNNGFIEVYSEPGKGASFKIYLPRHSEKSNELPPGKRATAEPGQETILLVEDERMILDMTARMLRKQGYMVLPASTPGEAMQLAREHAGPIHLLMTDVIMPEMNGRDLAKNLLSLYPDLKCLFMSGYTADVIAHHGVLDEGVHFIQKPFVLKEFAAKIRDVLDHNRFA